VDRIAVFSDIHGNLPALHAVLDDIHIRQINRIFCIGDLIGKGPSSDLVVDLVRSSCELVIQGNWDKHISDSSEDHPVDNYHRNNLGEERLDYLRQLPFSIEFYMSGKYIRLVHASPRSVDERIQPMDSFVSRLSLFDYSDLCQHKKQADILGYGDIHNAYIQNFQGKTLFNVGSVGNPLEITQASYAVLEGQFNQEELGPYSIQFVRVPYNIELAIEQAIQSGMPQLEAYILELRTAEYRGNKKS